MRNKVNNVETGSSRLCGGIERVSINGLENTQQKRVLNSITVPIWGRLLTCGAAMQPAIWCYRRGTPFDPNCILDISCSHWKLGSM